MSKIPNKFQYLVVSCLLSLATIMVAFPAFSQNRYTLTSYYRSSHDAAIIKAFQHLEASEGQESLDIILEKPIRVLFKDLREISKHVRNYDALSWISTTGHHAIFINRRHEDAPPEALAAIIAHEALHNDPYNSIQEEIAGWKQEAILWQEMKRRNPKLATIPKGDYPLVDRLNLLEEKYQQGQIEAFVRSQAGYKGLPASSPGFTESKI